MTIARFFVLIPKVIWAVLKSAGAAFAGKWRESPVAAGLFLLPVVLVTLVAWGPLPLMPAFCIVVAIFATVGIVRGLVEVVYRWRSRRAGYHYQVDFDHAYEAGRCWQLVRGLSQGVVLALPLILFALYTSPTVRAMEAQKEAERQEAKASGTLLAPKADLDIPVLEGTIVNPPERADRGNLLIVRVNVKGDAWSPRMAFLDPSTCSGGAETPKPGATVKIRERFFRAQRDSWTAEPGRDGEIFVFFVEPTCR